MEYSIVLFCPDQHLCYNINTLDHQGVGGGVTSRIRMAHALAARGHSVTVYINCPEDETINGVHYRHYSQLDHVKTDIFIASTSGNGLDLRSLCGIDILASLRILMVHGVDLPKGIDCYSFDFIYALSNYVCELALNQWGVKEKMLFVSHRGVKGDYYIPGGDQSSERDPFVIVYTGHPSKGLEASINILKILREADTRFTLQIYGGYRLWGGDEQPITNEPGVFYHGLIGQRELANRMQACGFSINLQIREEPFGMVLIEAMRAGCIVIASEVGAYPEVIHHGQNGFIVRGDHSEESTQNQVAQLIMELMNDPDWCSFIRENAIASPLDWDTVAETWEGHWDWVLGGKRTLQSSLDLGTCSDCGADWLSLADGFHCTGCGQYRRSLKS